LADGEKLEDRQDERGKCRCRSARAGGEVAMGGDEAGRLLLHGVGVCTLLRDAREDLGRAEVVEWHGRSGLLGCRRGAGPRGMVEDRGDDASALDRLSRSVVT
jgi:hypothetical protein